MRLIAAILLATTIAASAWTGRIANEVDGPTIYGTWVQWSSVKSLPIAKAQAIQHKRYGSTLPVYRIITGTTQQVDEITGETNTVDVTITVDKGVLRSDNTITAPTLDEWNLWPAWEAEQAAAAEAARQAAKPVKLKAVENAFLDLCNTLAGSYDKLDFATINQTLEAMMETDANTATVLSLRLLAIDAEAKREGGLNWWDDCALHTEILGGE